MESITDPTVWKILLIEDDRDDYFIIRSMLDNARQGRYRLEWVNTYEAGKQALLEGQYDAVLLDYFLGERSGLEFLKEVAAPSRSFPFILISGKGSVEMDLDVFEAGVTFSLTKSEINTSLLERSLHYAVKHRQLEERLSRSEATVRQKDRRMEEILNSIQDGFFELDRSWCFTYINQRAAGNGNFRPEELVGKSIWDVFPYFLNTQYEEIYCRVMETRRPEHTEIKSLKRENWYAIHVYPSEAGISVFWVDITARKQAEAALVASETALRESEKQAREQLAEIEAIYQNAPIGLCVFDDQLRWVRLNQRIAEINGVALEKHLGKTPKEIVPDVGEQAEAALRTILETSQPLLDFEMRGTTAAQPGVERFWNERRVPIKDDQGKIIAISVAAEEITERKRAEQELRSYIEALRESEAKFRGAFENAAIGFAMTLANGHFVDVNSAYTLITGYSIEELKTLPFSQIVHPDDLAENMRLQQQMLSGQIPGYVVENRYVRKDGQGIWVRKSISLVNDADGAPLWTIALVEDITDRKQVAMALENALASLTEERSRLLAVMEALPVGLSIYDMKGGVVLANTGFNDVWGSPRPSADSVEDYELYKAWWVKTGERVKPEEWAAAIAVQRGESVTGQFIRIQRFDGTQGYILNSGAPVRNAQGQVVGAVVAIMDITDRVRAEEALQESERLLRVSEEHFRVALKNSPMIVYTTDRELRYTWIYNPAFGFDPAAVIGKTDEGLNDPEDVSELVALKRSVQESGTGKRQEIQLKYQGQLYYYDLTIEPIRNEQGEVTGLTVAAIDITEQKQLEQARLEDQIQIELQRRLMDQREQERQQIARDIHDGPIQTLVSTIFNIQMAKESLKDRPLQVELNQIGLSVKNAVQELRDVVNELRPPSLLRFGLSKAIKIHTIDFQEKHPELEIILELDEDNSALLHNMMTDQLNLTLFRIYQEALNNVIRHAEARQAIIRLIFAGGQVALEIIDDGKGFKIVPDLTRQTENGHYGLAGMKERTEAVGGTFQVSSQHGKGTKIRVAVPLNPPGVQ